MFDFNGPTLSVRAALLWAQSSEVCGPGSPDPGSDPEVTEPSQCWAQVVEAFLYSLDLPGL